MRVPLFPVLCVKHCMCTYCEKNSSQTVWKGFIQLNYCRSTSRTDSLFVRMLWWCHRTRLRTFNVQMVPKHYDSWWHSNQRRLTAPLQLNCFEDVTLLPPLGRRLKWSVNNFQLSPKRLHTTQPNSHLNLNKVNYLLLQEAAESQYLWLDACFDPKPQFSYLVLP